MQLRPGLTARPRAFDPGHAFAFIVALLAAAAVPTTAQAQETGSHPNPPSAKHGGPTITASSGISAYSDTDGVHVLSPTVAGGARDDVAGWSVEGRYLVDAVSAASVDIISTASGHWNEVRHVGSGSAELKHGELAFSVAGGVSREPDYLSIGGGGTVSIEMMDKNVTPFFGASYGHDDVGRTGLPHQYWHTQQKGTFQVGTTFVVDRSTIASVAVDGIFERGYLAKPYRYVPIFAPGVAASVPAGASVSTVNALRLDLRPIDSLPDARDRYAVSGRIAHRLETSTVRADQRLYHDSWGMLASTTDGRLMIDLGPRIRVWPHARFHAQRSIDFWQRAYEASSALAIPSYRTGDRELGPLYTATAGGGIRMEFGTPALPWAATFQMEGIYTRYLDDLYITSRTALFGDLSFEAAFP